MEAKGNGGDNGPMAMAPQNKEVNKSAHDMCWNNRVPCGEVREDVRKARAVSAVDACLGGRMPLSSRRERRRTGVEVACVV